MGNRQQSPSDVPTSERMKHMATVKASTAEHKLDGERRDQKGASQVLSMSDAEALIHDWPKGPLAAARNMFERYGPPNESTAFRLVWYRNGPWKRTEVTSDEIVHNFPTPHTDSSRSGSTIAFHRSVSGNWPCSTTVVSRIGLPAKWVPGAMPRQPTS